MATPEELRRQRMQEQYNQPVYGPRNPPPAQPVQDTRPVIAQGDIGGALYGLGRAITSPQSTDQNPMMRSRFGVAPSAPAAPAVQQQPSLAAVAPSPAQPPMDPQIAAAIAQRDQRRANDVVLEQDRANLRGANFAPMVGPQPETTLSPQTLAATNQRIQAALDANRAPAQIPGERGNYNLANTSNVDAQGNITTRLRQPDNIIEGGYGQFGGGRAAQFLASRRAPTASGGMSNASEEVRLRNQLTSNDPFERRAAREQMATRQALALDAGATERTGMQLEGEQLRASLAGEAAVQAAQARAAGQQQAADIAGQYGLAQAETSGLARLGAAQLSANSGANALANTRNEREAILVDQAKAAFAARDDATGQRLLGVQQPAPGRIQTDEVGRPIGITTPTGFRLFTPEEIAEIQAASAQYTVPPQ